MSEIDEATKVFEEAETYERIPRRSRMIRITEKPTLDGPLTSRLYRYRGYSFKSASQLPAIGDYLELMPGSTVANHITETVFNNQYRKVSA